MNAKSACLLALIAINAILAISASPEIHDDSLLAVEPSDVTTFPSRYLEKLEMDPVAFVQAKGISLTPAQSMELRGKVKSITIPTKLTPISEWLPGSGGGTSAPGCAEYLPEGQGAPVITYAIITTPTTGVPYNGDTTANSLDIALARMEDVFFREACVELLQVGLVQSYWESVDTDCEMRGASEYFDVLFGDGVIAFYIIIDKYWVYNSFTDTYTPGLALDNPITDRFTDIPYCGVGAPATTSTYVSTGLEISLFAGVMVHEAGHALSAFYVPEQSHGGACKAEDNPVHNADSFITIMGYPSEPEHCVEGSMNGYTHNHVTFSKISGNDERSRIFEEADAWSVSGPVQESSIKVPRQAALEEKEKESVTALLHLEKALNSFQYSVTIVILGVLAIITGLQLMALDKIKKLASAGRLKKGKKGSP
ncbi:MAG TPA: hypothetical protein VJA40_01300 [archaeon]|nr:hypothetical protein [archaeon]